MNDTMTHQEKHFNSLTLGSVINSRKHDIIEEINYTINNSRVMDKHLIQALWLKLPIETMIRLIEKGACISNKIQIYNYDQYPLTTAIEIKLGIEYIKILDNKRISPAYKFWPIKHF